MSDEREFELEMAQREAAFYSEKQLRYGSAFYVQKREAGARLARARLAAQLGPDDTSARGEE